MSLFSKLTDVSGEENLRKNCISGSEGLNCHFTAVDGLSVVNLSFTGSEVVFHLLFKQQISTSSTVNLVLLMNHKIFLKNYTRIRNGHSRKN